MAGPTPQIALQTFLHAFQRLDLDAMIDCFAPEATAFFPIEHQTAGLEGKNAIGVAFASVLARLREKGAQGAALHTENVQFLEWADTAIATLHLRGEHLGRRTFILRRQQGEWHIVHLHASNAPLNEGVVQ